MPASFIRYCWVKNVGSLPGIYLKLEKRKTEQKKKYAAFETITTGGLVIFYGCLTRPYALDFITQYFIINALKYIEEQATARLW